jgi:hypothetical protein
MSLVIAEIREQTVLPKLAGFREQTVRSKLTGFREETVRQKLARFRDVRLRNALSDRKRSDLRGVYHEPTFVIRVPNSLRVYLQSFLCEFSKANELNREALRIYLARHINHGNTDIQEMAQLKLYGRVLMNEREQEKEQMRRLKHVPR